MKNAKVSTMAKIQDAKTEIVSKPKVGFLKRIVDFPLRNLNELIFPTDDKIGLYLPTVFFLELFGSFFLSGSLLSLLGMASLFFLPWLLNVIFTKETLPVKIIALLFPLFGWNFLPLMATYVLFQNNNRSQLIDNGFPVFQKQISQYTSDELKERDIKIMASLSQDGVPLLVLRHDGKGLWANNVPVTWEMKDQNLCVNRMCLEMDAKTGELKRNGEPFARISDVLKISEITPWKTFMDATLEIQGVK